jgi:ligand-binding sensor domain-containing protein
MKKNRMKKNTLLIIVIVLSFILASCQSSTGIEQTEVTAVDTLEVTVGPTPFIPQPVFSYYPSGGNFINDMTQDQNGNFWTATAMGVVRWNIDTGEYEDLSILNGVPYGAAKNIVVDQSGAIWVTWINPKGISRYLDNNWTHYTIDTGLGDNSIGEILLSRDGSIWAIHENSISRFKDDSWISYGSDDGIILGGSNNFYLTGLDGSFWILNKTAISRMYGSNWTHWPEYRISGLYDIAKYLIPYHSTGLFMTDDGKIWAATIGGIARFDGASWEIIKKQTNDKYPLGLIDVVMDRNGNYWVAGYGATFPGILRYGGKELTSYTEGLTLKGAYDLSVTSNGLLWAITPEGLAVWRGESWYMITGKNFDGANKLIASPNGDLWVMTDRNGLFRIHDYSYPNVRVDHICLSGFGAKTGQYSVNDLNLEQCINDGNNWYYEKYLIGPDREFYFVSPSGGIARIVGNKVQTYLIDEKFPSNIEDVVVDSDGIIWVISDGQLTSFDGTNITLYDSELSLLANVLEIEIDPDGRLWVGTNQGVSVWDSTNWLSWVPKNDSGEIDQGYNAQAFAFWGEDVWVKNEYGVSLLRGGNINQPNWDNFDPIDLWGMSRLNNSPFDRRGSLWIGDYKGKLAYIYIKEGQFLYIVNQTCDLTGHVFGVMTAPDGSVWLATQQGLCHITKDASESFDESNGLRSSNEYINDVFIAKDNIMWVATTNGLTRYDGENWIKYGYTNGIPFPVTGVYPGAGTDLWLSTTGGLIHCEFTQDDD